MIRSINGVVRIVICSRQYRMVGTSILHAQHTCTLPRSSNIIFLLPIELKDAYWTNTF